MSEHARELARRLARDLPDDEAHEAARELAVFDDVTRLLDEAGARERELERRSAESAPGEDEALDVLAQALADSVPRPWASRWPRVALAAAALAALVFFSRELITNSEAPAEPVPAGLYVGSSDYEALQPIGLVDELARFRWAGPLPPNGFFQVAVWDADASPGAEPLALSEELGEPAWDPVEDQVAAWPAKIRWQVRVYAWSRTQVDEFTVFAERASR